MVLLPFLLHFARARPWRSDVKLLTGGAFYGSEERLRELSGPRKRQGPTQAGRKLL